MRVHCLQILHVEERISRVDKNTIRIALSESMVMDIDRDLVFLRFGQLSGASRQIVEEVFFDLIGWKFVMILEYESAEGLFWRICFLEALVAHTGYISNNIIEYLRLSYTRKYAGDEVRRMIIQTIFSSELESTSVLTLKKLNAQVECNDWFSEMELIKVLSKEQLARILVLRKWMLKLLEMEVNGRVIFDFRAFSESFCDSATLQHLKYDILRSIVDESLEFHIPHSPISGCFRHAEFINSYCTYSVVVQGVGGGYNLVLQSFTHSVPQI
jgi:hypothetical protein